MYLYKYAYTYVHVYVMHVCIYKDEYAYSSFLDLPNFLFQLLFSIISTHKAIH